MANKKIRIRLKAYEHRTLDTAAAKIVETATRHPECGISGMLVLQCLCSHLDKYLDTAVFEQVSLDQPS